MPTVTVVWSPTAHMQLNTEPETEYQMLLQQASNTASAAMGMLMRPATVSYTHGHGPVLGWKADQQSVGDQDISIAMEPVPLPEAVFLLTQRVTALQEMFDKTLSVMAAPRISDVAALVVVYPHLDTWYEEASHPYRRFGVNHPAIQALSVLTNTPADSIVQQADSVYQSRYSRPVKMRSLPALCSEVQQCMQLIQACPSLRQLHTSACWVIENFESIRTAFGKNFCPIRAHYYL